MPLRCYWKDTNGKGKNRFQFLTRFIPNTISNIRFAEPIYASPEEYFTFLENQQKVGQELIDDAVEPLKRHLIQIEKERQGRGFSDEELLYLETEIRDLYSSLELDWAHYTEKVFEIKHKVLAVDWMPRRSDEETVIHELIDFTIMLNEFASDEQKTDFAEITKNRDFDVYDVRKKSWFINLQGRRT
jgi:acetolactate synthase small subunit